MLTDLDSSHGLLGGIAKVRPSQETLLNRNLQVVPLLIGKVPNTAIFSSGILRKVSGGAGW
eukprot:881010-Amphidinium_carterae.1